MMIMNFSLKLDVDEVIFENFCIFLEPQNKKNTSFLSFNLKTLSNLFTLATETDGFFSAG